MGNQITNTILEDVEDFVLSDSAKVDVLSGIGGKLKLVPLPALEFNEPFDSDVGFIYDSAKAEFSGGLLRQKDNAPANAVFGATYTDNIDGNFGAGTLTGVAVGGAAVVGNRLDLAHDDVRNVSYNPDNLAATLQTGCIRFKYTPNYSGIPTKTQYIVNIGEGTGTKNWLSIYHYVNGYIRGILYNSSGVQIAESIYYWPTIASGTTYEIEFNYDITTGSNRLFVDGVPVGSLNTGTGTRTDALTYFKIGTRSYGTDQPNFYIEDLVIFDSVQHTSAYTPGYTLPESKYLASSVILPEMAYTGTGTLEALTNLVTVESGSPRYTIQIGRSGNYLYWNGSTWAISNGTYSQSNDLATFVANFASLNILGEIYGQFKINFDDSLTQSSVSDLTATVTGQEYSRDNPYLRIPNLSFVNMENLINMVLTSTISGNDKIGVVHRVDGQDYWYNDVSGAWEISDLTLAKSNTDHSILTDTDIMDLLIEPDVGSTYGWVLIFHSDDGTTSPIVRSVQIEYDFYAGDPDAADKTIVYGYIHDTEDEFASGVEIQAELENQKVYDDRLIIKPEIRKTTCNSEGYWELQLVDTATMETGSYYKFSFKYPRIIASETREKKSKVTETANKQVPIAVSKNYAELVAA